MYIAASDRYQKMKYNRVGKSGLKLPQLSLGFWQNFGNEKPYEEVKEIVLKAFDNGITHFDLSNNYGRPFGSAESNLGKILKEELAPYRDELIISTKAGYTMWSGPYGDHGSRKYIMASLDQSLNRLGLKYVDIFYHHRPDYDTPLKETMKALADIVTQGKALYIGLSNYPLERALEAVKILRGYGVELLIHQPKLSMLNRWVSDEKLDKMLIKEGVGMIPFSVLSQGLLTMKYVKDVPLSSRAGNPDVPFLNKESVTVELKNKLIKLNDIAITRNQSLAQMAISWAYNQLGVSSVLLGVSKISQLEANLETLDNLEFSSDELTKINEIIM